MRRMIDIRGRRLQYLETLTVAAGHSLGKDEMFNVQC
jgi:hypothetical protein